MSKLQVAQELKGLQSQLAKARADANAIKTEMAMVQRRHHLANQVVQSLEQRIAALEVEPAEPIVSEHAMLRWLERVDGVDLDALRRKILGDGTAEAIAFAQNGRIKKGGLHKPGITLVVKNSVVVTVEGLAA